jgi:hypothetical protein
MKTLWIFGDSFSTNFDYNNLHDNHRRYLEIMGINEFKTWPIILAEKLGCELKNLAKGGDSNYQTFQTICDNCHEIKENDIVIVGWGLITKFRISYNNKFVSIHPQGEIKDYGLLSKETIQELLDNRLKDFRYSGKRDRYAEEVNMWEKIISVLAKNKKFEVYFWNSEEKRLIYCEPEEFKNKLNYLCNDSEEPLIHYLRKKGCTSMEDETGGLVSDSHFGIGGHNKQANIFHEEIINEKRMI